MGSLIYPVFIEFCYCSIIASGGEICFRIYTFFCKVVSSSRLRGSGGAKFFTTYSLFFGILFCVSISLFSQYSLLLFDDVWGILDMGGTEEVGLGVPQSIAS